MAAARRLRHLDVVVDDVLLRRSVTGKESGGVSSGTRMSTVRPGGTVTVSLKAPTIQGVRGWLSTQKWLPWMWMDRGARPVLIMRTSVASPG